MVPLLAAFNILIFLDLYEVIIYNMILDSYEFIIYNMSSVCFEILILANVLPGFTAKIFRVKFPGIIL